MPILERGEARISFEVRGTGHSLLLFAPGGMASTAQLWGELPTRPGEPAPWIDPRVELSDHFCVISMDQRNAGASSAPVSRGDGWATYTADHLALLEHLEITRTHLMGGCIGSSYALALCDSAPDAVTAAVLQNPIGLHAGNRGEFLALFDRWANDLRTRRSDVDDASLSAMKDAMFEGDFVFSVHRDALRRCSVPLLVLPGDDAFHPYAIGEEIVDLAPKAELLYPWEGPERHRMTVAGIREFLLAHTP
ncbi:MAG TPA: alpha/beta fold hydrolase [Acidimicrobiales bacterium]|nr:alpha/beta fold hydrolase [Acidimicrobiales bacterium]